jgi:Asp-tRNA(Asn)/Glu-tRNA(Gln) amidotransferase A subunit family amidase
LNVDGKNFALARRWLEAGGVPRHGWTRNYIRLSSILFLTLAGSAFSALRRSDVRFIQNSADVLAVTTPARICSACFPVELNFCHILKENHTGPKGLPIGIQLIGHRNQDHRLLDGAQAVYRLFSK